MIVAADEAKALATIEVYLAKKGKVFNYHPTPEEEVTLRMTCRGGSPGFIAITG